VKKGEMVSIIANTRVEWTVADLGIAHAGAVGVPIYQSNTAEECRFILDNCGAVVVFVEDQKQLGKLSSSTAPARAIGS
jgi:long-chain acyl-CoA synthetase